MNILVLCHDIPSPTFSDTLPVYHLIKSLHLECNHNIDVICFDCGNTKADKTIEKFIKGDPIQFSDKNSISKDFLVTLVNMFRLSNLKHKINSKILPNLLDFYYKPEMDKKIKSALKESEYDLIYLTRPMASYVVDLNIPKFIQPYDAVYKWHEQIYKSSKGIKKAVYGILYSMTKYYEKNVYNKFDSCLVVTEESKKLLKLLNPNLNVQVIPNGVNLDYFKPMEIEEDFPSLIFVSDMSTSPTPENVLHFYENIFPLIREKVPKIKLYLVGRNPVKEIKELSVDPSIIVTGYVDDIRPYLAKASIFVAPMIMGTGIKNKVLEAMAMAKPIVSTEIGVEGINGKSGTNFMVTDKDKQFAEYIIDLLNNKELKEYIGFNAHDLIEKKYSWKLMSKKFNELIPSE